MAVFPDGAASSGALDMAGNVLERCLEDWNHKAGEIGSAAVGVEVDISMLGGGPRPERQFGQPASRRPLQGEPRKPQRRYGFWVVASSSSTTDESPCCYRLGYHGIALLPVMLLAVMERAKTPGDSNESQHWTRNTLDIEPLIGPVDPQPRRFFVTDGESQQEFSVTRL